MHLFPNFSAPGGDFQSVLDDDMVPFEEHVQGFLRQILEALQFIHDKNIAHLDIKVRTTTTLAKKTFYIGVLEFHVSALGFGLKKSYSIL